MRLLVNDTANRCPTRKILANPDSRSTGDVTGVATWTNYRDERRHGVVVTSDDRGEFYLGCAEPSSFEQALDYLVVDFFLFFIKKYSEHDHIGSCIYYYFP